jgi:uncharacterized membrane protein
MKQLLIGFANNISANKQKILVWHKTFKQHSNANAILIAANTWLMPITSTFKYPDIEIYLDSSWSIQR